jgi:hypothetical protein
MSLHKSRSSKRNKPGGDAGGDASLFTVARITNQLESIIESEDITRLI